MDNAVYYQWDPSHVVTHAQAVVTLGQDGAPRKVNRYQLSDVVGSGSFAQVVRALLPPASRGSGSGPPAPTIFAVKILNKRALQKKREWKKSPGKSSPRPVSLFDKVLTEIDIWETVRCRNIIALVEVLDNESDPNLYVACAHAWRQLQCGGWRVVELLLCFTLVCPAPPLIVSFLLFLCMLVLVVWRMVPHII